VAAALRSSAILVVFAFAVNDQPVPKCEQARAFFNLPHEPEGLGCPSRGARRLHHSMMSSSI
jgi:hypothetical protein